jgi:hypothetical protein
LHEKDQDALKQLCVLYNDLRGQLLSTQEQNQGILDDLEAHMASAIEQLGQLRVDVMECIEIAQEEIDARSSKPTNTVMCVSSPRHLILSRL